MVLAQIFLDKVSRSGSRLVQDSRFQALQALLARSVFRFVARRRLVVALLSFVWV